MSCTRSICLAVVLSAVAVLAAPAQNPVVAFPFNYKIILENRNVTVLRIHFGPHETIGLHDHSPFSSVDVYLDNGGALSYRSAGLRRAALTRPPTRAGAFRITPGRVERHTIQSLGNQPFDSVRIELKGSPADQPVGGFHSAAPSKPLTPGITTPYETPGLRVERIICAPNQPCEIKSDPEPSVLVAIPTGSDITASHHETLTEEDPILWLSSHASTKIKSESDQPLDLLRIIFPRSSISGT